MIIDGKKIAGEIKEQLVEQFSGRSTVLAVVLVGEDPASIKFVEYKKKFGEAVGVEMRVLEFEADITEEDLAEEVEKLANDDKIDGMIIQLPLPKNISTDKILNLVPANKDVDALTADASVDSPVVEAVMEILDRGGIDLNGKKIVVVGRGQLVGRPIAVRLAQEGYDVEVASTATGDLKKLTLSADVIISGVGKPGLITPDMVKDGVVLVDAGTSDLPAQAGQASKLAGDIDPTCADKASLYTPVPGGVGPLVVAMLFKNLAKLSA
ncbi:MAG: bifunctional 5,10-methylenetetrahydrofolate dehydrogenase/5,10-methenyltetrahydrofolate cyclohydrolase [Candidatus Paceibacterota bacterium]|jgi:methylenetetrahydrofolate dehydrogenase (NADP+)/methenyltetrahydrofolate cyclohydrolase